MEKERLEFTINRFDHYYESVNNKANVVLGISTLIVGGLVAFYPTMSKGFDIGFWTYFIYFTMIGVGILIILILIFASIPFLKKSSDSLIYFKAISEMSQLNFVKKSEERTKDEEYLDLRHQTYDLASGLTAKFKKLRVVFILLVIQLIIAIPYIILLITNI